MKIENAQQLTNVVGNHRDVSFNDAYVAFYPGHSAPRSVTFVVTEKCSLRCAYCYERNNSGKVMTLEVAKKAVDMLFREDERNSRFINPVDAECLLLEFIGGEPLLEIDLIDKIVSYFLDEATRKGHRWATNYMLNISTNGVAYFEKPVQEFVERYSNRLSINVTIDGGKELHDSCRVFPDGSGSYDIASAAFKDIVSRYEQEGTKLTIAPGNVQYLFEAVKSMRNEFGISYLMGNCVFEKGWTIEHAQIFFSELVKVADWIVDSDLEQEFNISLFEYKDGEPCKPDELTPHCGGSGKMMAIGPDGNAYPCLRYMSNSLNKQPPIIIGHVDRGFYTTEEENETLNMMEAIDRRTLSPDECFNCPVGYGCAYCIAYNYDEFGTPDSRATYICDMHKARALAITYFWNRLFDKYGFDERKVVSLPRAYVESVILERTSEIIQYLGVDFEWD